MSYCFVILRTPSYWSVRIPSRNFKPCRYCWSRKASNMTSELCITSVDETKDFYVENFARAAADEQNGPGLRESWEKAVPTRRSDSLWSSLHQHINYQQPRVSHTIVNNNCLFQRRPRKPVSYDTVVWIQTWTRNEKIGSLWVQTCHVWPLNIWSLRRR